MAIRTGKASELTPLDTDKQSHLLISLARNVEELSSGKDWPDGIVDLIADLGHITGANRVWLFQVLELSDKHMLMNFPFEWVDEQTHALKLNPRYDTKHWDFETCSPTYRRLVESRRRGEWQTAIIQELENSDFKDYQISQGVQSTLSIPVMVQGKWWGLLGLDDCTDPHEWSDEEISLVRIAAHLISNAVLNNRLSSTNRQFEILSSLTESSAWELDANSGYCWCDPKVFSSKSDLSDNIYIPLLKAMRHIHSCDRGKTLRYLRTQIQRGELNIRTDLRVLRDNDYVWIEVIAKIILDKKGRLKKLSGIIIDIPQRKKEEAKLLRQANLDSLTGIANRGSFDNHLMQMIHDFVNAGTIFSLLLLDLDHFKKVNDTWGHNVGDQALKHVVQVMQNTLREGHFIARIGGEEFAILVLCTPSDISETIAERIRYDIASSPLVTPEGNVQLTVSIGICNTSKESANLDAEVMLRMADNALYEAKNSGRNKVVTN
ncbi:MAG: diguanylate cyclase [Desulfotalea sp.]